MKPISIKTRPRMIIWVELPLRRLAYLYPQRFERNLDKLPTFVRVEQALTFG